MNVSQTSPLGASKSATSAMSIVDSFLNPQKAATVSSDSYDQQMSQFMNRLNKVQSAPSYQQKYGVAAPPTAQQPPTGSY